MFKYLTKYAGHWLDETQPVSEDNKKYWRIAQWFATGGLWWTWLSHDYVINPV
jgi:hypothetical protein